MSKKPDRRRDRIAARRRRLKVTIARELEAESRIIRAQFHQRCGASSLPHNHCYGITPGSLIRLLVNPETHERFAFHWAKSYETCWHYFIWHLADQRARELEAEAHPE